MNSLNNQPLPVENMSTVKSQEGGFEDKINEIDEYCDMADEALTLLEKKIGPVTSENVYIKAQDVLSESELDLISTGPLSDRESGKDQGTREVMKQHIKNGDTERGSVPANWLVDVKAVLGKLKYE